MVPVSLDCDHDRRDCMCKLFGTVPSAWYTLKFILVQWPIVDSGSSDNWMCAWDWDISAGRMSDWRKVCIRTQTSKRIVVADEQDRGCKRALAGTWFHFSSHRAHLTLALEPGSQSKAWAMFSPLTKATRLYTHLSGWSCIWKVRKLCIGKGSCLCPLFSAYGW